jgi:hypothetical protein
MSLKCPHKVNKGELLQGELRFSLIFECLTIKRGCLYVLYVFFVLFFGSHWDIPNHGAPLQNGDHPQKDIVKSGYEPIMKYYVFMSTH